MTVSIKQWQKENYHKSMMHFKETKDMEVQFRKVRSVNHIGLMKEEELKIILMIL